jgi:hypothetical protein
MTTCEVTLVIQETFHLADVAAALAGFSAGTTGKIVVVA